MSENKIIRFDRRATGSERYEIFDNTEAVADKNQKGQETMKKLIASGNVYVHKSVAGDEPYYMLVPGRFYEAMMASIPKAIEPDGRKKR